MSSSIEYINEGVKTTAKKMVKEGEIFASCTFASLGLDPTLCDQLRGVLCADFILFFFHVYLLPAFCYANRSRFLLQELLKI